MLTKRKILETKHKICKTKRENIRESSKKNIMAALDNSMVELCKIEENAGKTQKVKGITIFK